MVKTQKFLLGLVPVYFKTTKYIVTVISNYPFPFRFLFETLMPLWSICMLINFSEILLQDAYMGSEYYGRFWLKQGTITSPQKMYAVM